MHLFTDLFHKEKDEVLSYFNGHPYQIVVVKAWMTGRPLIRNLQAKECTFSVYLLTFLVQGIH